MTSKEALENIKNNYPLVHPTNYKLIKESYDTLEQLAERDTPKKVGIGTSKNFKFLICPNCKTELNEYYKDANKFCKECGQRLDWG